MSNVCNSANYLKRNDRRESFEVDDEMPEPVLRAVVGVFPDLVPLPSRHEWWKSWRRVVESQGYISLRKPHFGATRG